jgi:flagellar basal-body rod protein FlgB
MEIGQLPLLTALRDKMRWHQARQNVRAQNVANADTPGYRAGDLAQFNFAEHARDNAFGQISTIATNSQHISISSSSSGEFGMESDGSFQVTPNGNGVSLEDEMMKMTGNQMDYQMATTLYQRSMRIMRVALGRQA